MKFSKLISWHAAFVNTFTLVFGGADELRPLTVLCFVYTLIGCSAFSVCSRCRELFNNFRKVEARHNHNQSLGQNTEQAAISQQVKPVSLLWGWVRLPRVERRRRHLCSPFYLFACACHTRTHTHTHKQAHSHALIQVSWRVGGACT